MNLATMFEFAVERYPSRIAVVEEEKRYTYNQLNKEITKVASSLQRMGIKQHDRVIVVLKNRLENIIIYWAVQKLGAVYTPINHRLSAKEVEYCVNDAESKAVVYENASQDAVLHANFQEKPILIGLGAVEGADIYYDELVDRSPGGFDKPVIHEEDIALMLYTSGTTGMPKGVPRSHKNEYSAAIAHIVQNQYTDQESTLGTMPLYHTMGMRSLLSIAFLNGKYVVLPDFDARDALELLSSEEISSLYLVPTLYHDILSHHDFHSYHLGKLRKIGYAGASMTTALTEKCVELLKPQVFVNHYGSTEIYTFTICPYVHQKPGCAGKPGLNQNIRLVKADAEAKSLPDDIVGKGEIGEIIVNLDSIEAFKGYWNKPNATQKAIREGWYFTGDLGVIDDEGDLFVVGRVDDMIISGGENIHPLEVEDVLSKHPKVSEVAVVGEEDERWGQIVSAFIVPIDPSITFQELDEYCKSHPKLSNFKRPRNYVFLKQIPKSPVGKILRRKIRDGEVELYSGENQIVG
ncbi:long-chain fatty acid--CoA ligase [Peribacillus cavernae]|uniref:Long-chain fatty acid--CoA ligase n=1 Tax=Peribacillus cavernae TaxID=1674310 RepID=A0A433HRL9_9BACI|nr:AMP-binding protein [Peribacillus cavernae]MDQ0218708.1 2-furoate---CoA ligase [Peribacillus cavernae]RUQ30925.1 long-chain fatty acid--CoA ligase [Peribacillus cavernae]